MFIPYPQRVQPLICAYSDPQLFKPSFIKALMDTLIEFKDVTKRFQTNRVLDSVNIDIKENQIFGLIGPSGAGKSTVINILLGLVVPNVGTVHFKGRSMRAFRNGTLKKMGFCTQENSFYPRLTVCENLQFYGSMYGIKKRKLNERIDELLDLIDLKSAKHRTANKLSGGMKRRLDFAIALVHNPEVLILDEPTTGLDIVIQRKIWALINKIHKQGKTVIIASHMLNQLQEHCTSYGLLYKGKFYDYAYCKRYMKKYKLKHLEDMFIALFGGAE